MPSQSHKARDIWEGREEKLPSISERNTKRYVLFLLDTKEKILAPKDGIQHFLIIRKP